MPTLFLSDLEEQSIDISDSLLSTCKITKNYAECNSMRHDFITCNKVVKGFIIKNVFYCHMIKTLPKLIVDDMLSLSIPFSEGYMYSIFKDVNINTDCSFDSIERIVDMVCNNNLYLHTKYSMGRYCFYYMGYENKMYYSQQLKLDVINSIPICNIEYVNSES